jgi:hypothetical protein
MEPTVGELQVAIELLHSPEDVVYANACALMESIGFEGPMYSAGPFERLCQIYKEEIQPRINSRKEQFDEWVLKASIEIQSGLNAVLANSIAGVKTIHSDIASYLLAMQSEGLAGPKTARVVFLFATADALKKLMETEGGIQIGSLTLSELLMIAVSVIRIKMDITGEFPNEK